MIKFNIKSLRVENDNISQKAVSDQTGIRLATLADLEHDKAKTVSIKNLDSLCVFFKCSLSDLITYIPDGEPEEKYSKSHVMKERIRQLEERVTELEERMNRIVQSY